MKLKLTKIMFFEKDDNFSTKLLVENYFCSMVEATAPRLLRQWENMSDFYKASR